jgi:hypothetical protein
VGCSMGAMETFAKYDGQRPRRSVALQGCWVGTGSLARNWWWKFLQDRAGSPSRPF